MNWVTKILQNDINDADTVIDIGCGIFMTTDGLKCKSLLGIDAWPSYLSLKKDEFQTINLDISKIDNFKIFINDSYDVITCIDVIEHLEKEDALLVISELKRIARKKVIIFTPNGFVEQHDGLPGSWGENNPIFQKHRSGWDISDFQELNFKTTIYPDAEHDQIYAVYEK